MDTLLFSCCCGKCAPKKEGDEDMPDIGDLDLGDEETEVRNL